jgi:hypothetical protein
VVQSAQVTGVGAIDDMAGSWRVVSWAAAAAPGCARVQVSAAREPRTPPPLGSLGGIPIRFRRIRSSAFRSCRGLGWVFRRRSAGLRGGPAVTVTGQAQGPGHLAQRCPARWDGFGSDTHGYEFRCHYLPHFILNSDTNTNIIEYEYKTDISNSHSNTYSIYSIESINFICRWFFIIDQIMLQVESNLRSLLK